MSDDPQTDEPTETEDESPEDFARDIEEDPSRNPDDEGLKNKKGA